MSLQTACHYMFDKFLYLSSCLVLRVNFSDSLQVKGSRLPFLPREQQEVRVYNTSSPTTCQSISVSLKLIRELKNSKQLCPPPSISWTCESSSKTHIDVLLFCLWESSSCSVCECPCLCFLHWTFSTLMLRAVSFVAKLKPSPKVLESHFWVS